MTSKQAQRSKQKKAQKRKKQLAVRRATPAVGFAELVEALGGLFQPGEVGGPLADLGVTPEDYLPDGQIKVSAALLAMAQPILDSQDITSRDAASKLLTVVMTAWNLEAGEAMGHPADELVRSIKEATPADVYPMLQAMIDNFRRMKRSLFPDDHRVLVDLKVVGPDGNWRVNVTSIAPPP